MMYYVNPYSGSYGDSNIIEDPEPEVPWAEKSKSYPKPIIITIPAPAGLRNPREAIAEGEKSRPSPQLAF